MVFEGIFTFLQHILFFTSFVSDKGSFPHPLSKEEERDLIQRTREGDSEAKENLIRHNLRLVAHVVKKYNNAAEADDMISVGTIGLIKAINTYSFDKGTQLATYAAKCIDNEILMYIRAGKKHRNVTSLSESIGKDKEGGDITLVDLLCSDEEEIPERVERAIMAARSKELLTSVLDKREYEIICLRFGFGIDAHTQREVANKLGISRSYISRIEKKALSKVRKALEHN